MLLLGLALAVILPCLLVATLIQLETYHAVRLPVVVLALLWGMVSYALARQVEIRLTDALAVGQSALVIFVAPIVEEGFKSAFIILIYTLVLVRYTGDAMIYGFTVGSGFAILENLVYILLEPLTEYLATGTVSETALLGAALARIASTGLVHAGVTAVTVATASVIVFYNRRHALSVAAIVVLGAVLVHAAYNGVLTLESGRLSVVLSVMIGGAILVAMIVLLNFNYRHEYNQVVAELHYDPESLLAHKIPDDGQEVNLFDYVGRHFGRKQVKLVEAYLVKEEQIAVYVEHLDNGDHRAAAVRAMKRLITADRTRADRLFNQLEPDVQALLREMGLYNAVPLARLADDYPPT